MNQPTPALETPRAQWLAGNLSAVRAILEGRQAGEDLDTTLERLLVQARAGLREVQS